MKTTSTLFAAALVMPALPSHAASLEILSGFDGMQSGTISRSNSLTVSSVNSDPALASVELAVVNILDLSEDITVARDGDAVTINASTSMGRRSFIGGLTGPRFSGSLIPTADGRNEVSASIPGRVTVRSTEGVFGVAEFIDIVFSIDAPYAFSLEGGAGGPEPAGGFIAILDGGGDPADNPFTFLESGDVILALESSRRGSGLFREIIIDDESVFFSPFGSNSNAESNAEVLALLNESTVLDADFFSLSSFSGVLQPGDYRLLTGLSVGIDGSATFNSGSAGFTFSAQPVGQGPAVVPTPSALAGGIVGALALLRRRRRA